MGPQRKKRETKKPVRLRCTGTSSTDNGEGQQIVTRCRRKRALKEGQTKSTILCSKCEQLQSLSDTQPTGSLPPPGTNSSMGRESIAFYGFSVQCTGKLSNRAMQQRKGTSLEGNRRCSQKVVLWDKNDDPRLARCPAHKGQPPDSPTADEDEDIVEDNPSEEEEDEDYDIFGPVFGLDYGSEHFENVWNDGGAGSGGAASFA